jgi:hypothetical protein
MILDKAVNEVVLANVGTTGEFRIRNSAKAFSILSSGLYSNKIRAIIRELSCNAVDSHVGAGRPDMPFEVHLPTVLEPYFAVRDFGMGLDDHQVVNIYTTYFESTKTDSNAFIGALGLGSKSPFSYTENFTVTAIKNGMKRIYSAFINEQGVPSIAQMSEELTDAGNGVEVKFSVTDRSDYNTFRSEAHDVFKWFKLQPRILGNPLTVAPVTFKEMNIVPGVHVQEQSNVYDRYGNDSVALMGNISYPLKDVPQAEKHFGELAQLLNCNLVLEFDIGELDFAASREVLSYIPLTISSIKKKLEMLNANLATHLAAKANLIAHPWERADYLVDQCQLPLYKAAVHKYVIDTKFELFDPKSYHGKKSFKLTVKDLTARGLSMVGFRSVHGTSSKTGSTSEYIGGTYVPQFEVTVDKDVTIVLNDLKTGCLARARFHFNYAGTSATVICVSHTDPDVAIRQVEYDKLMVELHNPPRIVLASALEKEIRKKPVSSQGITKLRLKANCRSGYTDSYKWEPYSGEIDDSTIYYYVALNNHQPIDKAGNDTDFLSIQVLMTECGISDIANIQVYGVRKSRIAELEELDNWVHIEDKLREETGKITDAHVASLVLTEMLDSYNNRVYTNATVAKMVDVGSDYAKYFAKYGKIKRVAGNVTQLVSLCGKYGKAVEVVKVKKEIEEMKNLLYRKYPFLKFCRDGDVTVTQKQIAEYITMVDKQENTND